MPYVPALLNWGSLDAGLLYIDEKLDSKFLPPVMMRAGGGHAIPPPAILELLSVFCSLVVC